MACSFPLPLELYSIMYYQWCIFKMLQNIVQLTQKLAMLMAINMETWYVLLLDVGICHKFEVAVSHISYAFFRCFNTNAYGLSYAGSCWII